MRAEPRLFNDVCLLRRLTVERRAYFTPDKALNELVGYCTAVALSKTRDLSLAVACALPDGPRSVITDPKTERSDYKRDCHSLIARALNDAVGRRGDSLFRAPPGDDCRQLDRDQMLDSIVELIVEPVRLGLVRSHKQWPGFQVLPGDWGKRLSFERPDYFDADMPQTACFVPQRPPGFEELSDAEFIELIRRQVNARERETQAQFEREGRTFLGPKGLKKMARGEKPAREPAHAKRLPRFAASDPQRQAAEADRVRAFEEAHEQARQQMLDHEERLFPEGTYWWRLYSDQPVITPTQREPFAPP